MERAPKLMGYPARRWALTGVWARPRHSSRPISDVAKMAFGEVSCPTIYLQEPGNPFVKLGSSMTRFENPIVSNVSI
jgi:hypothetical protein